MDMTVEHVDVWAASIQDEPGGLAARLAPLSQAGADLDFVIARRSPERPGTGVVFVTPLRGDREVRAASQAGFSVTESLHSVRVEGTNAPGMGYKLAQQIAEAGLNLRGVSAAVIGPRFIAYFAFDTSADADRAIDVLKKA
ncbi:MAG: ACT domain protein [Planctomycetes bacterium ADurb.Bin126]|nr:MAG: ACT domain protein [Planctomycetes bacterium ADurb.Bin126]HOD82040.1 amino acid-binding protein [Phycisphaerae bacterium]HQL72173.1 amino acid-binding protein [Phycisphaerae bacterium]